MSPVSSVDKQEGGFNKALFVTTANEKQVVVKMPFPALVSESYSVESEVATLKFGLNSDSLLEYVQYSFTLVRDTTSIPVPEVLAWSSHSSNPVGVKYIILEKCPGCQLHTVWGDLDELCQFELVKTVANFDSQLASIAFPVNGNLHLRAFAPEYSVPLDMTKSSQGKYCIGPNYSESWLRNTNQVTNTGLEAGPWPDLSTFGLARARQGAWHVKNTEYRGARSPHFGSPDSHLHLLELAMEAISVLAGTPSMQRYGRPTLWHTDLHMGNIFVSEETPTEIVGVIDWQSISILPALTQVQWPEFLTPPEDYEMGAIEPQLPPDSEEMDPDEKSYAISQRNQAMQAKCYEVALSRFRHDSYACLTKIRDNLRRLFVLCERTYKDGNPPMLLSKEELTIHEIQMAEYHDWTNLRKYTQQILISDDDGCVSPELDFEKVQAKEKELFELYLQRQAPDITIEEARELWFCNQHDIKA